MGGGWSVGKVEEAVEGEGVGMGIAKQNEKRLYLNFFNKNKLEKKKNKRKGV